MYKNERIAHIIKSSDNIFLLLAKLKVLSVNTTLKMNQIPIVCQIEVFQ